MYRSPDLVTVIKFLRLRLAGHVARMKDRSAFKSLTMKPKLHPFCTMFDLQVSFYRPLCYNSGAQCPLLQCLCTTRIIGY